MRKAYRYKAVSQHSIPFCSPNIPFHESRRTGQNPGRSYAAQGQLGSSGKGTNGALSHSPFAFPDKCLRRKVKLCPEMGGGRGNHKWRFIAEKRVEARVRGGETANQRLGCVCVGGEEPAKSKRDATNMLCWLSLGRSAWETQEATPTICLPSQMLLDG